MPSRPLIPFLLPVLIILAACTPDEPPAAAREIAAGTTCALDGMLLNDYPGPKAQIHYGEGKVEFFCDTVEMFNMVLRPESARRVRAVYTQDMGKADWKTPRGHWIDARQAFYVHGSRVKGSMGPTLASFANRADAETFARQNGGRVLRFDEVHLDMVDLHGGAAHDERM
ncbi:MAG: nitrous oxide reductase accessory protein NosL [Pseudomonadota bacterium]